MIKDAVIYATLSGREFRDFEELARRTGETVSELGCRVVSIVVDADAKKRKDRIERADKVKLIGGDGRRGFYMRVTTAARVAFLEIAREAVRGDAAIGEKGSEFFRRLARLVVSNKAARAAAFGLE